MKITFHAITIIIAMLIVGTILIVCIANNIDHSIVYAGLTIIGGLAGFTLGRATRPKD